MVRKTRRENNLCVLHNSNPLLREPFKETRHEIPGHLVAHELEADGALLGVARARFAQHPFIGDIRGRGLFIGLEIVEDKGLKKPFDPKRNIAAQLKTDAFENGLICYPMRGTRDGEFGDHLLLAPPFIMEESNITELADLVEIAVLKISASD